MKVSVSPLTELIRPDDVLREVSPVREQVAEHAAAGAVAAEPPGEGAVGVGRVVGEQRHAHVRDGAERAFAHQASGVRDGRGVPVVEAHRGHETRVKRALRDLSRFAGSAAHRLLDPEGLAGADRGQRDLVVQEVRRADGDDIDVGTCDQLAVVRHGLAVAEHVDGMLPPTGIRIGGDGEIGHDGQLGVVPMRLQVRT
ncbi:hypothetical protein QFZ53_000332 [Microbacterium natoriense]|uniref:Uncharacterized protein n=1 Tax=Microbacterium natoriense TaxID=284570 RepID=A0AAW8ERI5_9MICO|nr:hypothetical protein [Microbacterium natoriense]